MFSFGCTSYSDKEAIPARFAYHGVVNGKNTSPGFAWADPPIHTKSFALAIVDPHPVARNWVHWLVTDIPFRERGLAEGASRTAKMPPGSRELRNSFGELGYGGPAPPKGSGEHPYVATIYALNTEKLDLDVDAPLSRFRRVIEGKVIEELSVTGHFERK